MNEIGKKIETDAFHKGHRLFSPVITRNQMILPNKIKFWSWGANHFVADFDKVERDLCWSLRFSVTGRKFRGHVYIVLNGADLYDIYYTTTHGTIKMIDKDIYADQMNEIIDNRIEKIDDYSF